MIFNSAKTLNKQMKTITAADLFCGAGGTSSGLVDACKALGMEVNLTAVNHWDVAIATHEANHPDARHLRTAIDNINPRQLFAENELDVLWASPECTHHSTARGGRPINDQSRATAWCVIRWADALRPKVILIENVPEFENWGPTKRVLRKGIKVKVPKLSFKQWKRVFRGSIINRTRKAWKENCPLVDKLVDKMVDIPDPKHKGEIFQAWVQNLRAFGYKVDWRVLCCADFGDPTTRQRLFVYAVRGSRKVIWPEPTHASADELAKGDSLFGANRLPWVAAREIIDWSDKGRSIFNRKIPLVQKTLERILIGLNKFGGLPFVVPQNSSNAPRSTDLPAPTLTTTSRGVGLAQPFLMGAGGPSGQAEPRSIDKPLGTVIGADRKAVVNPELKPFVVGAGGPERGGEPQSCDNPLKTVLGRKTKALVAPFLVKMKGTSDVSSVENPAPTVCAGGVQLGVAQPCLINMKGQSDGASIDKPIPTITAHAKHIGVASPVLVEVNHGNGTDPLGNERRVHSVDKPMKTVTAKNGVGVAQCIVGIDQASNPHVRSANDPLSTVTSKQRHGLADAYLIKYNGTGGARSVDQPLDTVTTRERFGLVQVILEHATQSKGPPVVEIDGERYVLEIYFRMLKSRELALAQGFKPQYVFTGTGEEVVKQIGNAVPYHTAKAIVRAALSQKP